MSLPDGWVQHQDPEGLPFYHNASTGESTYEPPLPQTPAGGAPPPAPAALPEGWAAHHDPEGRVYYANATTGETSWDPPPTVGTWSLDQTYGLGPEGCEYLFQGKVQVLDGSYNSVSSTVEALVSGAVVVDEGICVLYSQSKELWYLLWRSDKEEEARAKCFPWSGEQVVCLGPVGHECTFEGKAELLPKDQYTSVSQTIDALNIGQLVPERGYCVIFSDSQQLYYLAYRADKEEEATSLFPAWQAPEGEGQ